MFTKRADAPQKNFLPHKLSPSWALPSALVLLGALLRLVYLGSVPGGVFQDESIVAWNAYALFHEGIDSAGHAWPVYMADWGDGHSALYVWLSIPMIALGGGHINTYLCRLPQAITAILSLVCVYGLMKRLFNRRFALWALFLLAICPWHIIMSRWGLDVDLVPGFLIFSLYFFVRGLENEKFLLLSGLCYGLSLHCYAVIWPIVPIMLALQILYGLCHKKLRINRWSIGATLILFVIALPLILFVLVNMGYLPEISLPFLTIPQMGGYRGSEIALSLSEMYTNLRTAVRLFIRQDTGAPYDFLLPWGLFYDIGRVFIVIGAVILTVRTVRSLIRREYSHDYWIFVQLLGGGITCLLVTAKLHQINAIFLPLVLCEAYGVYYTLRAIWQRRVRLGQILQYVLIAVYLVCLVLFQKDYYTEYRELTDTYFIKELKNCLDYAYEQCEATGLDTISVEKGAQWPRLLMYTETLPSVYLDTVVYDEYPAPARFDTNDGLHINTRIDYEALSDESVYIFYFTELDAFRDGYDVTAFGDYWYVAVPKQP